MSARAIERPRSSPSTLVNNRLNERLLLGRLRQRLLAHASGAVLDVACGEGANFLHFPDHCRVTAGDIDGTMLAVARVTGKALERDIDYRIMDAEHLPFTDNAFDTVVSSMALCSYANPTRALHEMARVCNPNGLVLLLEHGRSSFWPWAAWQDMKERIRGHYSGCHDNREPRRLLEDAGLEIISASRTWFGVIHIIEARPGRAG